MHQRHRDTAKPDNNINDTVQRKGVSAPAVPVAQLASPQPAPPANDTGLPDQLKAGVESLSSFDMGDVKVHYNSVKPAQLNAFAYAQGSNIHIGPGQERHLPHEAWHVAQQKQGRVQPTMQMKGDVPVNDDPTLEFEADAMGAKAAAYTGNNVQLKLDTTLATGGIAQLAGDYTGKMPIHEATSAPKYDFGAEKRGDHTYHHIIPENYIHSVLGKITALLNGIRAGGVTPEQTAQTNFHTAGLAHWSLVRAKNTAYYLNQGLASLKPLGFVNITDTEVLNAITGVANTAIARQAPLHTLVMAKVTACIQNYLVNYAASVNTANIAGQPDIAFENTFSKCINQIAYMKVINARTPAPGRKTETLRVKSYRAALGEITDHQTIATAAFNEFFNYKGAFGMPEFTKLIRENSLDNADTREDQEAEMALWVPGNIHQGPKSSDRLQGDETYRVDQALRNDPAKYDVARDDGGGNFEQSASRVLKAPHFQHISELKAILESIDATGAATTADTIRQMYEKMTQLYGDGITYFKDTVGKWKHEPDIKPDGSGAMRL